jgi:hypothetical protein
MHFGVEDELAVLAKDNGQSGEQCPGLRQLSRGPGKDK